MFLKGISISSLAAILLLCRHAVVIATATNISYQILYAQTKNTIDKVDKEKVRLKTKHSINESEINQKMNKWSFGVSDCWNYSMTEEARLNDNNIRLKMLKRQSLSIYRNVTVDIHNLQRAIRQMRKKLGYSVVSTKVQSSHNLSSLNPKEKRVLQVVFLSTVDQNLQLMLNDFRQRIQTKA